MAWPSAVENGLGRLPKGTRFVEIQVVNHAGFGNYGLQSGEGLSYNQRGRSAGKDRKSHRRIDAAVEVKKEARNKGVGAGSDAILSGTVYTQTQQIK